MDWQAVWTSLMEIGTTWGLRLLGALIVLVIALRIIRRIKKWLRKSPKLDKMDSGIRSFLSSFVSIGLYVLLVIMMAGMLGIPATSLITILASCGVAIGLALQGALSNFAGGLMILLFRPFKVGDFIEAQGQVGTVKEIQIFNTLIQTGDNKTILVPNGPLSTGIINNYSRESLRRVDFTFSISYGDDYEKAKEVLLELIAADKRILNSPVEPFIALKELGASSINIVVRVWAAQADYWDVYFDLNKAVYETFPKRGLNFPYQTFTVNVNNQ